MLARPVVGPGVAAFDDALVDRVEDLERRHDGAVGQHLHLDAARRTSCRRGRRSASAARSRCSPTAPRSGSASGPVPALFAHEPTRMRIQRRATRPQSGITFLTSCCLLGGTAVERSLLHLCVCAPTYAFDYRQQGCNSTTRKPSHRFIRLHHRRRRHGRVRARHRGCPKIRRRACCCSKPGHRIARSGSTCRSATARRCSTAGYNWGFHTDPEPGMNGRRIYWPRGKTLGGSSAINGLIYIRGQREDYDRWRALGNVGWGWDDVLPYFIRSEGNERGASPFHGGDGPLSVLGHRAEARADRGVHRRRRSSSACRAPTTSTARTQEGAGYFQLTTHKGWRSSAATAYLKPARAADRTCASKPTRMRPGSCSKGDARSVSATGRTVAIWRRAAQREVLARGGRAAVPAAVAAIRHRAGRAARAARHRCRARPAGRGREPAGPPADSADRTNARSRSRPTTSCARCSDASRSDCSG